MGKGSISKAILLSSPDPVDCSWCALEQGAPTTDSPGVCDYHSELLQRQSATIRADRAAIRAERVAIRQDETLGDFLSRKLGGR